ncbi:4Fe-4S single cluster domain-containing protein [Lachnospiraceae bacterium XBD2001]|nr:4Fe-4S single cluster domain-containing protein [Lachnospiraceae bacterium XBD2001]
MAKMQEHINAIMNPDKSIYTLHPPLPTKLTVELNETCNSSCVFCTFHSSCSQEKFEYGVMKPETAKRILKEAYEKGIGMQEVALFATGEPFLYVHLAEVVAYAKELGFPYVYLTTNGTLSTIDRVQPVIDAGIDSIRFSINAGTRESYKQIHGRDEFDQVIANVKTTADYIRNNHKETNLSASFVKTKITEGEEKILSELLKDYIDEIVAYIPHCLDEIASGVKETYGIDAPSGDHKGLCPRLFNTMYINSTEAVLPCCASQNAKKYHLVELSKTPMGLDEAWYCDGLTNFRKMILEGKTEGTVCEGCYMRDSMEDVYTFDLD